MNYMGMTSTRVKKSAIILLAALMAFAAGCATAPPTGSIAQQTSQTDASQRITGISTTTDAESTTVTIRGTEKLAYTSVKQPFPAGVVLYFPETNIDNGGIEAVTENAVVSSIETFGPTEGGKASRVNILLKQDVPYEATQNGTDLKIVFKKSSAGAQPAAGTPESQREENLSALKMDEEAYQRGNSTPVADSSLDPAWMNRIDFSSEEAGKSRIIIGTSRPVEYNIRKVSDKRLKLDLFNTNIPVYRQRQLITTRFESAVDRIIPVQTTDMKRNSVISIELREAVPYFVERSGNVITVSFEASSIPPRPMETASLPEWKRIIEDTAVEQDTAEMPSPAEEKAAVQEKDDYFDKKEYTGEKVALDFYETDIKNVFRILREISGENFVIDDDVKGKVTMTLDEPVPWDQILDLVLKMNQLGLVYEGDIIRIATLKTIKQESEALMASVQADREAKEKIKDLAPLMTEYISVSYSNAKEEVLPHLESLVTEGRGSISVDGRNNQIIMTDTADKIMKARGIVQNIDKVTPQVIIEAKVVEISSDSAKDIGIEWSVDGGIQPTDARAGIGPQRGFHTLGGTYGWTSAMNFPAASNSGIGFNFTRIAGTPFVLDAKLTALASSGEAKIISAPKIVTLDNKKAKISQGVEVGYYDSEEGTETGRDVEWKKVDLLLEVSPHVTPDSRVSMNIVINKNEVVGSFDNIPTIGTNEAQTELLVNDGDTIVIGGIMKTTARKDETGFPVLSKIPGLGWLFRQNYEENSNNELLIFITPRIVQLEQKNM